MPVEIRKSSSPTKSSPQNLMYDTDGVSLVGIFSDQISAYRAKREWVRVFSSHFLLEPERDYEIAVNSSHEKCRYSLTCTFNSACGRYAFWRLINRQAPEAERKLGGSLINAPRSPRNSEKGSSWVADALNEQVRRNEETKSLIDRLLDLMR